MKSVTYAVGPVLNPVKKKHRKEAADNLAKQLMKLLAEDFDVIEISGYKFDDDTDFDNEP